MATAAADVDLVNRALALLGVEAITSLADTSKPAATASVLFDDTRASVFRAHPWNCLIKRVQLAQDTTTPAWGFTFQYTLPSDCLRVLQIKDYDADYKIEGRKLLINESQVYLIYLAQITDVNELDVLLRETISAHLAQDISYAITSNLQVTKLMAEKYQLKLSEAKHTDASEGYNTDPTLGNTDQVITDDFINSRY
jgi:hypothetical protein